MASKKKVAKKKTASPKLAAVKPVVIDLADIVTAVQTAERSRGPIEPARRGPRREVRRDG